MVVFDFIYFCIYSLVPDKAILGKRDVACTYFSSFTAIFLYGVLIYCSIVFMFKINPALSGIILFGSLFILARMIFLKPTKFKSMHRRFRNIPKWILKTIGIMYILFCATSFVFCGIQATLLINSR